MKRFKSILALASTACIFASSLSGCAVSPSPSASPSAGAGVTAETSGRPEIEYSIAVWEIPTKLHEETAQLIKDKFGIKIKPITIGWGDWEEKIKMLISSGDAPDIFAGNGWGNQAEFAKLIDDKVIRDIPEEYIQKYPNIKAVLGQVESERWNDGKFYHFPRLDTFNIADSGDAGVLFYRKDWAEKLGISEPQTIDEFYTMAEAFAKKDPDGNGKNDTYGITTSLGWVVSAFNTMFGNKRWMPEGDGFVPAMISDTTKTSISWLKKLYDEGILDPEFQILTNEQRNEKFALGKAGVTITNGDLTNVRLFREALNNINPDLNVEESVDVLNLLSAPDGTKTWAPKAYWSVTFFSSKLDDAKMDRALEFYNWLASDEAFEYLRYGVEGRDFKKTDSGYETLLTDSNGKPTTFDVVNTVYPIRFMAIWNNDKIAQYDNIYSGWDKAMDKKVKESYFANDYKHLLWVSNIFNPINYERNVVPGDEYVKLIMESKNFEEDWKKFVDSVYKQKDFDKYLEYMNSELKAKNYSIK